MLSSGKLGKKRSKGKKDIKKRLVLIRDKGQSSPSVKHNFVRILAIFYPKYFPNQTMLQLLLFS